MTVVAQGSGTLEAIPRPRSIFQRNLNLVRELSITSFKLKYTGSALGYVWSLVKPLMLFGIMYLVFSVLLKTGGKDADFPVELLFGIVIWTFFVESTTLAMNAIAGAGELIRKAYFPRWILVVSSTASAALSFVINTLLVVVVTVLIGKLHLSVSSLLAPLYYIELIVLVLSLLLSALFVFFRDLGHIWEIASLVLFYGSAVIYPFVRVQSYLRHIAGLNPVLQIVQDVRHSLVDAANPLIPSMFTSIGWFVVIPILITFVVLGIGFLV